MTRRPKIGTIAVILLCASVAYAAQVAPRGRSTPPQAKVVLAPRAATLRPGSTGWQRLEAPLVRIDPLLAHLATTRRARLVTTGTAHPERSLVWTGKDGTEYTMQVRPQEVGGKTKLTLTVSASTWATPEAPPSPKPPSVGHLAKDVESKQEDLKSKRQEAQSSFQTADQRTEELMNIMSQIVRTMNEMRGATNKGMG